MRRLGGRLFGRFQLAFKIKTSRVWYVFKGVQHENQYGLVSFGVGTCFSCFSRFQRETKRNTVAPFTYFMSLIFFWGGSDC